MPNGLVCNGCSLPIEGDHATIWLARVLCTDCVKHLFKDVNPKPTPVVQPSPPLVAPQ
jgi:hypothetical protein